MSREPTRAEIIERARRLRDDIDMTFRAAEYWNRHHPESPPVIADPRGELRRCREMLDRMLAAESGDSGAPR